MARLLAVSDRVEETLRTDAVRRSRAQMVVGCGDLPFDYLGWLGDVLDVPVVFVPGNHDPDVSGYRCARSGLTLRAGLPEVAPWPAGAYNADGAVVDVAGLRIAGLGGCVRYGDGPNQYSQGQQSRRARRLVARARWAGRGGRHPVDVVITHAPARGVGDEEDPPHRGFEAIGDLVSALKPRFLLHGHVDPAPGASATRIGTTAVVNVFGHRVIDIADGGGAGS